MVGTVDDVFANADGRPRLLRGTAIYSGSARLAELAIKTGFDTVWVEMEHGPIDFQAAEAICLAAEVSGGFATIRVSDGQRCHVLRALEVGARIVVVPMVNTADEARQIVQYGKFPPVGLRGYNSRSRGVQYGLVDVKTAFALANQRVHLLAQIETTEAVNNLDSICAVEGLSGILIGPGDLSISLGCTADMANPRLGEVVSDCIRRARAAGKHAGILVSPGPLLRTAITAGCDLCFCGGDYSNLIPAWQQVLDTVKSERESAE